MCVCVCCVCCVGLVGVCVCVFAYPEDVVEQADLFVLKPTCR